jgi:SAM-dependent methyltransferase
MPCVHLPSGDHRMQTTLALLHQVFLHALQGKLTTTRILPSTRRILDLGTGPGHWAVAMSRQYNAEVVGIDLTEWDLDTTEDWLGDSKVIWEIDDLDVWGAEPDIEALSARLKQFDFFTQAALRNPLERSTDAEAKPEFETSKKEAGTSVESLPLDAYSLTTDPEPGWHFSDTFDLIHLRNMTGAFAHWEEVYAEIYKSLSPGGWVEIADFDMGHVPLSPQHGDSTELPLPTVRKIMAAGMEASFKSGRPLGLFYMHPSYLEEAGFTDIQTTHVNVPVGQWHEDAAQKSIGKLMLGVVLEMFESVNLRNLTKWGDKHRLWTEAELAADREVAQQEILDWCARAERGEVEGWCLNFKWITGRKSRHA